MILNSKHFKTASTQHPQDVASLPNTDPPMKKVLVQFYFRDYLIMILLLESMADTVSIF